MNLGEIIMEKNKFKLYIPVLVIIFLLIATIYKINKNREDKLYNVLYGKIEYAAKECFLKKECTDTITLQDLYDKNYLEIQYDPVTKEILDSKQTIDFKDNKVIINK